MRALTPFASCLLLLVHLSFAHGQQAAGRDETAGGKCRANSRINLKSIAGCATTYEGAERLRGELARIESELSRHLSETAPLLSAQVNADAGAQCAHAQTVTRAVSAYKTSAAPIDRFRSELKREVLDKREIVIRTIFPQLTELARQADCLPRCSLDSSALAEVQRIFLDQRRFTEQVRLAEREWVRLIEFAEREDARLVRLLSAHEERIRVMEDARTAVFSAHRCAGEGPVAAVRTANGGQVPSGLAQPRPPSSEDLPDGMRGVLRGAQADPEGTADLVRRMEVSESVRRATLLMVDEESRRGTGSGFYVRTIDESGEVRYKLVTAHHVPNANPDDPRFALDNSPLHAFRANDYRVEAGTDLANALRAGYGADATYRILPQDGQPFSRREDVIVNAAPPGAALDVAREGELPDVGQQFTLHGHPGSGNLQYTTVSCTFMGYTTNVNRESMAYLMDCPEARSRSLRGMSGGPVVDANTGTVYGLVSGGYQRMGEQAGRIMVAPIYQSPRGQLQVGPQPQVVQQNCYNGPGLTRAEGPFTCSILPQGAQ